MPYTLSSLLSAIRWRFKPNEPNKPIKLNKPNEHQETAISFESPQRLIKQIAWPDPGLSRIKI
jgi:hypothetical protein